MTSPLFAGATRQLGRVGGFFLFLGEYVSQPSPSAYLRCEGNGFARDADNLARDSTKVIRALEEGLSTKTGG
jgi:hypothetical protein